MSIAAALATSLHHSSQRQKKARAGEEESEKKYTAKFRMTPPPQAFFQLYDEEPGGWRPASLAEPPGPQERVPQRTVEPMLETFVPVPSDAEREVRPGSVFDPVPQGRVVRHVVEHRIEMCPFVQILDAPVPQMGIRCLSCSRRSSRLSWSICRFSQCPRSLLTGFPSVLRPVLRRRQNSFWKCRRNLDMHWRLLLRKPWGGGEHGRCTIRSLPLQFLRVGRVVVEVFMILVQDSVFELRL